MDLKLTADHDIEIDEATGDLVLVDGVDAIAQDCDVRLKFFLGEWYLDTRLGVPYYQQILGQKPRLTAVKGIFRKAILSTPGIRSFLEPLEITFDGPTRTLGVSFRADTVEGSFEYNKELIV
jgi:hypothetical protein